MSNVLPDYLESILNKRNRRPKLKYESLEQGSATYRILPSFDAARRQISQTYNVHWLTGEDGKKMKVSCTYYSERYCPLCDAHRETKNQMEVALQQDPKSDHTRRLQDAEQALRNSKTIYYNALNADNEPVVLQLTSEAAGELENSIIEAITQKGFDPLALNGGAWFLFKKNGKGRGTVKVDFNRLSSKDADGEIVEKIDRRPISDELSLRLPNEVANIFDPKTLWIQTFTSVQLADYLRGKPLPVQKYGAAAQTSAPQQEYQTPAPQAVAPQAQETQQAQAPVAAVVAVTHAPVVEAAPAPAARVNTGKTAADYAAEAARLRSLASPKN